MVDSTYPKIYASRSKGIFFDEGAGVPTGIAFPANWQDYTEAAGKDLFGEYVLLYREAREYLKSLMPGAATCMNSTIWDIVKEGDCFIVELAGEVHKGATYYSEVLEDKRFWKSASYDQTLPENNPTGVKGIYTVWDTAGNDFVFNGGYVAWDRANRSPMTALAAYYIVANENTRFAYNTEGWVYWKTDEFTFVDASPNFHLTAHRPQDLHTTALKYISGNFASFPAEYNSPSKRLIVRMGTSGEFLPVWKVSDTQLATDDMIAFFHPHGTGIYIVREGRMSAMSLPPLGQIVHYAKWFPASAVDIGVPDPAGYNGGRRNFQWKNAAEAGTAAGIQRRDFTRAIILHAPGVWNLNGAKLAEYGNTIPLGGTYYPLLSTGRTGPAVTSIRLRNAEGVVLMKQPL
jgi:hypothetical protein